MALERIRETNDSVGMQMIQLNGMLTVHVSCYSEVRIVLDALHYHQMAIGFRIGLSFSIEITKLTERIIRTQTGRIPKLVLFFAALNENTEYLLKIPLFIRFGEIQFILHPNNNKNPHRPLCGESIEYM